MHYLPGNAQHVGRRAEQQDSFGFSDPADAKFRSHGGLLAVLADGMGGLTDGRATSQLAVSAFLEAYASKPPSESIPAALARALKAANQAVLGLSGSGSTLVAAVAHRGRLHWISTGDSRLYLCRRGGSRQLTTDHVYARELEEQVRRGELTADAALAHPERDSLTSFLGRLEEVDASQEPVPLAVADLVLLCSDGLYRTLSPREIAASLRGSAHRACERLVARVLERQRDRQDNVTVLAIGCERSGALRTAAAVALLAILCGGAAWVPSSSVAIRATAAVYRQVEAFQKKVRTNEKNLPSARRRDIKNDKNERQPQ